MKKKNEKKKTTTDTDFQIVPRPRLYLGPWIRLVVDVRVSRQESVRSCICS